MPWQEYVSNDTHIMLESVKKRHTKYQKCKQKKEHSLLLFALISSFFIMYLFFIISNSNFEGLDIFNMVIQILTNPIIIPSIIIIAFVYYNFTVASKKEKKEKEKYHKVRAEVIEYLKTDWYETPYSSIRDDISNYMEEFDIDLRTKTH